MPGTKSKVLTVAVISSLLVGCAGPSTKGPGNFSASGASQSKSTAISRAWTKCFFTVAAGAAIGAIIAGGEGAAKGAAIGGVACAGIMLLASEEDRRRAQAAEAAAVLGAASGGTVTSNFTTEKGEAIQMTTRVEDATIAQTAGSPGDISSPSAPPLACRYATSSISAKDKTTTLDKQLYCRSGDQWVPWST